MNRLLQLSFFFLGSLAMAAGGSKGELTRENLMEGAEFPERREFPVNSKINPCSDLYEHACSKTIESFKLRDDRSHHTFSFGDHGERLLYAKRRYLRGLATKTPRSDREKMMKNSFLACMDEKASAEEEKELVESELKKVSALENREAFQKLLSDRIDEPYLSMVGFDFIPNQQKPEWDDVILAGAAMTLPEPTYYQKEEVVKDLQLLAADFFKTLGVDKPDEKAKWVVELEKEFAKTQPLPAEVRQRMTAKDHVSKEALKKKYPSLHLDRFLGRIPAHTQIRDMIPESMKSVEALLSKKNIDQLKALYLFHEVSDYMDDAYPEYYKKKFEFNRKHMGGPEVRPAREERCTKMIMNRFDREIDAELLPILFPDFPREKVVKLAEGVRESIIRGLGKNTWLSPAAKKAAIKKMTKARLLLVSPETEAQWDFNPKGEYSASKPYENSRTWQKLRTEKEIAELKQKRDRSRWEMGPLTVNAYYVPMDNVFVLPIGILQYPFFDPTAPEWVNIGAIGTVVGHELGHGIDDQGAQYDDAGQLKSWMSKKDLAEFQKRGQRFVSRFDKIGHNGKLTLGENIGDHVGLTFAYNAAFENRQALPQEKQQFFLQYARAWCQVIRPKLREMLLKVDPHSMGDARTDEQVKHQAGFYEAYGCKVGDPMYLPESERIRVW